MDQSKILASQLASKGYFAGEVAGFRMATGTSKSHSCVFSVGLMSQGLSDPNDLEKVPPKAPSSSEIQALLKKMTTTMDEIRGKKSVFTVQDLKRLLFRCAATIISQSKVLSLPQEPLPSNSHRYFVLQCEYDLLHYLVAVPFEVSTPAALSAGIEVWTWVISEKPEIEVALLVQILGSWHDTIKHRKGLFSAAMK